MSYGQVSPSGHGEPRCYRHPDRVSYVSCARCNRPVCPECQVSAPVGVQCRECVQEANRQMPTQRTQYGGAVATKPMATYTIIALNILAYLAQWALRGTTQAMMLVPGIAIYEPWRLFTNAFAHSTGSIFHILMNMYGIYIFGTLLEPRMGRLRFIWLYMLSLFGGTAGIMLLSPPLSGTLGASGALAGLFIATLVALRGNRGVLSQLGIVLVLNIVLSFTVPNISWQGHLGGAIVGGLAALCITLVPRGPKRNITQLGLLGALSAVLAIVLFVSTTSAALPLV